MRSFSRIRLAVRGFFCLSVVLSVGVPTANAADPSEFTGTWLNIDSKTKDIPKIEIGVSKSFFTVRAWGACVPKPCDWGTKSVPISSLLDDTFTAVYEFDFVTVTLTMTWISANSLKVHEFVDFTPGHSGTDYEIDEFFYQEGEIKPDLVVTHLTIPKSPVVYQESPWTWVTMTVKNIGPGIVQSGTLRAEVSGSTRNGEPFSNGVSFTLSYSAPLYPGQTATHEFVVGHNMNWPVGVYSLRVRVDPDNLIAEANERNNLSAALAFDVAEQRFLAGTIRCNDKPLTFYTDLEPSEVIVADLTTIELLTEYIFHYDSTTGHYLFSGLPDSKLRVYIYFRDSHPTGLLPGDYWCFPNIDLSAMTAEQASEWDIDAFTVTHLLVPWDNRQLYGPDRHTHCPTTEFTWESVDGAAGYLVQIHSRRDKDHPNGEGIVDQLIFTRIPETSYVLPKLPALGEWMYYDIMIGAFAADGANLSYYRQMYQDGGSRGSYEFKVCPSCVPGDVNQDCRVDLADLMILAGEWLVDTR